VACRRDDPAIAIALRAEAAIGAAATGADVELAGDWLVQARPIVHAVPRARVPPPEAILAPLHDGRVWHLDVAHNPDPLSPAQAGLVERIERAAIAPWSARVCAGFLYTARADQTPAVEPELAVRAAALEARFAEALGDDVPALPIALARYEACYRIWVELSRLISSATRTAGARPSAIEATLIAAARGELAEAIAIEQLGVLAPAWDVAVPTFGERPGLLRDAIARARSIPSVPPGPVDLAADLAERDDAWFARAQLLVRRSLLARGEALGIGDDIFWLPLDEVVAATQLDLDATRRRAAAARAAAARVARWDMPLVVGGPPPVRGPALHGVGTGPRVSGRVVRFASLASAVVASAGDIVVTRSVTPALAVLVIGCAAIVSETGGLLDHGAALARELGIPCVVGCRDAWSLLVDGQLVTVDGDRGTVT
jgi:phosphohistidine swiveling domain-containing protein